MLEALDVRCDVGVGGEMAFVDACPVDEEPRVGQVGVDGPGQDGGRPVGDGRVGFCWFVWLVCGSRSRCASLVKGHDSHVRGPSGRRLTALVTL